MSIPETNSTHPFKLPEALFLSHREAALHWHRFGFNSIPTVPTAKRTVVSWDEWLHDLSTEKITKHWLKNPEHEVGFIVGDEIIVLDADSAESITALAALEKAHNVTSNMVVKTTKGEHRYYNRAKGTFAKSDSHSTKDFPDRLDVKTGRALVILPPSTGKNLVVCAAKNTSELAEVGQGFIDAVFLHNGRQPPRPVEITTSARDKSDAPSNNLGRLQALLEYISPDCGYEDWCNVLMAIHHETSGSEEGFELADSWSSKGNSYKGTAEIRTKWRSFAGYSGRPITIATIIKMAKEKGADVSMICVTPEEQFEVCETEVIFPGNKSLDAPVVSEMPSNPLDKYSLRGMSNVLEKNAVNSVQVMGGLALVGQATALFAAPNTGKTILTLNLIIEDIKAGRLDPTKVYYLNMDDSGQGLLEKVRIAEEYGFHMLAEGHLEFSATAFMGIMRDMIENDQARGVVIILDTLKKFVDLMDKGRTSAFTNVIRPFVMKGGTVIALAHTNKHPGRDGKPVYAGVSDILNDIDCAFTIAPVSVENGIKVVEFTNIKSRGSVVQTAAYNYCIGGGIPYNELLLSVKTVDQTVLEPIKQAEAIKSDSEVIAAVLTCISEGINTKMKMADAVAKRAGISKRSALQLIEKYTGNDPAVHRWDFKVMARGANMFVALDATTHKPESAEP